MLAIFTSVLLAVFVAQVIFRERRHWLEMELNLLAEKFFLYKEYLRNNNRPRYDELQFTMVNDMIASPQQIMCQILKWKIEHFVTDTQLYNEVKGFKHP